MDRSYKINKKDQRLKGALLERLKNKYGFDFEQNDTKAPIPKKISRPTYNWENKQVLIVEDDQVNYQLLQLILKKTGIQIFHATTGSEAVQLFEDESPDIVLMDIQVPEINGIELTRRFKKSNPDTPVIAQTASILESQIKELMATGCDDYVMKPINRGKFLELLNGYVK